MIALTARPQVRSATRSNVCVTGVVEAWEVRQVVKAKDEATTSASEARKLLVWVIMILGVSVIANAIIVVRRARGRGNPVKCGGGKREVGWLCQWLSPVRAIAGMRV